MAHPARVSHFARTLTEMGRQGNTDVLHLCTFLPPLCQASSAALGPFREKREPKMNWQLTGGFHYNKASVSQNAPAVSGVYVLYTDTNTVDYVGEAEDIRTRLLQHLANEDNPLVRAAQPKYFAFVQVGVHLRLQVQNSLILELRARCNRKLG